MAAVSEHEAPAVSVPKNNASFYLGPGRVVLEVAPVDEDDDDECGAFYDQSVQISRYEYEQNET